MPYTARRRRGEPISTAFVESAINEIVAKRMTKAQQMRWNRATVQPFLNVRTAVLNDALEDAFRQRYPGFRPANDAMSSDTQIYEIRRHRLLRVQDGRPNRARGPQESARARIGPTPCPS